MKKMIEAVDSAENVVAMTGAGISTLCGIPDFRSPQGLYKDPDADKIFDIDFFRINPSFYYRGCRKLVYGLKNAAPGPVHLALKKLEDRGKLKCIVTQNIDMLHQKAGSSNVQEVHGSPLIHRCFNCGKEKTFNEICDMLSEEVEVARCECGGAYKPDITFFGESLPEAAFAASQKAAIECDVMLVLGTSLTVYPAADIPRIALQNGAKIFIVNAQPTSLDSYAVAKYRDLREFADAVLEI